MRPWKRAIHGVFCLEAHSPADRLSELFATDTKKASGSTPFFRPESFTRHSRLYGPATAGTPEGRTETIPSWLLIAVLSMKIQENPEGNVPTCPDTRQPALKNRRSPEYARSPVTRHDKAPKNHDAFSPRLGNQAKGTGIRPRKRRRGAKKRGQSPFFVQCIKKSSLRNHRRDTGRDHSRWPHRPALLRYAEAGCTWPACRCGSGNRS